VRKVVAGFAIAFALVSCSRVQPPSNAPAVVVNRPALPSCGQESVSRSAGFNVEARSCFWDAYQHGRPAEFISTELTTEGDPVTSMYRVLPLGNVEVFIDSTKDKYGSGTWTKQACQTLQAVTTRDVVPDFGIDDSCVETTIH
jgi:hypothetical protein